MLDDPKFWFSRSSRLDSEGTRAPYALPRGVPALQQDPEQLRRRLLMGIALVALVAGSAGFLCGRSAGREAGRDD